MLNLNHLAFAACLLILDAGAPTAASVQQMAVTLGDSKATLHVDGKLPLLCMTAAIDAATELGYDGVTASQVKTDQQTISKTGVSFFANFDADTVTFRAERPVPSKVVICFLRHLRSAKIENVRFASTGTKVVKKAGEPSDAPKDRESRFDDGKSTAGPRW